MDDSSVEDVGKETLKSIFDDEYATTYISEDGKRRWRCEWCKKDFSMWNATKALQHLTKQRQTDIAPCKARILDEYQVKYKEMYSRKSKEMSQKSISKDTSKRSIENLNEATALSLDERRGRFTKTKTSPYDNSSTASITNSSGDFCTPRQKGQKSLCQLTLDGHNPSADSKLTMAIADFIHSCGLPFSIASHPKFRQIIALARCVGGKYRVPSRNQVSTDLLDVNYEAYMKKTKDLLAKDIKVFGISFIGDGATVKRMPLINILSSGAHLHTGVMEIVDATDHMKKGGKKDAEYISDLFRKHIDEFEEQVPNSVDYCSFDGAASVQKAGEVLQAIYPRIVCTHGAEHVIALFFQDIFKNETLNFFVEISRKLYLVFGSGCMHAPYAIFQNYSKQHNSGKNIGLIRSAETRMGGEGIALQRLLRLKEPLQQTVDSVEFLKLKLKVSRIMNKMLLFCFKY